MAAGGAVTAELLLKHASGATLGRGEKPKGFLQRVTHFNINGIGLRTLDGVELALGAKTIYAFSNKLEQLGPGIGRLKLLQQLYVEDNELTSLDALVPPDGTPSPLEKVFASGNRISRVTAALAHATPSLSELHLGRQRLGAGARLFIEEAALAHSAWAFHLRVLDVSRCGLTTLRPLARLQALTTLLAGDNPVADVGDALALLAALPGLERLDVRGCTFTRPEPGVPAGRYRDALVAAAGPGLEWLDGKEVTEAHKAFMRTKTQRSTARAAATAAAVYRRTGGVSAKPSLASLGSGSAGSQEEEAEELREAEEAVAAYLAATAARASSRDARALVGARSAASLRSTAGLQLSAATSRASSAGASARRPASGMELNMELGLEGLGLAGGGSQASTVLAAEALAEPGASSAEQSGDEGSGAGLPRIHAAPEAGEEGGALEVAAAEGRGFDDDALAPGEDDEDRSPEEAPADGEDRGYGDGHDGASASQLGDTLRSSQAPAVRRASGVFEERAAAVAAAPLPPLPPGLNGPRSGSGRPVGSASGFRPRHGPALDVMEATRPVRTPGDLTRSSRFFGGYASPQDKEHARMLKEAQAAEAEAERLRAGGIGGHTLRMAPRTSPERPAVSLPRRPAKVSK